MLCYVMLYNITLYYIKSKKIITFNTFVIPHNDVN